MFFRQIQISQGLIFLIISLLLFNCQKKQLSLSEPKKVLLYQSNYKKTVLKNGMDCYLMNYNVPEKLDISIKINLPKDSIKKYQHYNIVKLLRYTLMRQYERVEKKYLSDLEVQFGVRISSEEYRDSILIHFETVNTHFSQVLDWIKQLLSRGVTQWGIEKELLYFKD